MINFESIVDRIVELQKQYIKFARKKKVWDALDDETAFGDNITDNCRDNILRNIKLTFDDSDTLYWRYTEITLGALKPAVFEGYVKLAHIEDKDVNMEAILSSHLNSVRVALASKCADYDKLKSRIELIDSVSANVKF